MRVWNGTKMVLMCLHCGSEKPLEPAEQVVSAKKASCSGPHDKHDCQVCQGPEKCCGWTEEELTLMTEHNRLYCLLLDQGLSHAQIRADSSYYKEKT